MGIYDRDYYRDHKGFSLDGRVPACFVLAGVFVGCFLLQLFTEGAPPNRGISPLEIYLSLNIPGLMDGGFWRLVTYSFLQPTGSILALICNCLFLVWSGRQIEELYGWKEFLAFYFGGVLCAAGGFLLLAAADRFKVELAGPGPAITAVLLLYACHFPRSQVLLFFVIPCPIWIMVAGYVLFSTVGLAGGILAPAVFLAHAAAALFALVYFRSTVRFTSWFSGLSYGSRRSRLHPKLHLFDGNPPSSHPAPAPSGLPVSASVASAGNPSAAAGLTATSNLDEHLEAKLDEVLEKVRRHGQESLSEEERAVLFRASEIYRKRRKHGGN